MTSGNLRAASRVVGGLPILRAVVVPIGVNKPRLLTPFTVPVG